ncbi:MAG: BrnA antitoxin family protein [Chloroflexi bacterium]|nr:BrnA antitoxin family protein [Chloroflexota bacterium]
MSERDTNKHSQTDWRKLEAMTDEEIDYSDIPPLDDNFFARSTLRLPHQPQVIVTMQVDPDVFAWFSAQKDGWEQRMRAALRIYVEAHKDQQPVHAA